MRYDSITLRRPVAVLPGTVDLARVRFVDAVVVPCGFVLSDPGGTR